MMALEDDEKWLLEVGNDLGLVRSSQSNRYRATQWIDFGL